MVLNELRTNAVNPVDRPLGALAAAKHMCERSGWTLTNLQLQKMLYLAQMMYMGQHEGARLLNGQFEAWDYGPVQPLIYNQVKTFGRDPIRGGFFAAGNVPQCDRKKMLDEAYDQLSKMSAAKLVDITHWKEGAWAKFYIPGVRGIVIPDSEILDEYRRRLAA